MKRFVSCALLVLAMLFTSGCRLDDLLGKGTDETRIETDAPSETDPVTTVADSGDKTDTDIAQTTTTTEQTETQTPSEETPPPYERATYLLNSNTEGIKILGVRCLSSDTRLNCDWTGSGVEMNISHGGGDIEFFGSASNPCYFRAYVDGIEKADEGGNVYYTLNANGGKIILKDVPAGDHTVKLIKVTGYTLSRAQLLSVSFAGVIQKQAPADKDLYIEFVGDSISCGWGTIGGYGGQYTDQDGTLAYPLKVATALDADYSVTALSGQGLLMGYPGMTQGYLYASALRDQSAQYGFERKADVVVINIGTNDYHYSAQYGITAAHFKSAYKAFLKTVREKNGPDCKILCLYNTMNDTYANELLAAVDAVGGESAGVYVYKTEKTDGHLHPNIAQQEAYTATFVELIQQILED